MQNAFPENPEAIKQEDDMYMQMKATLEDATMLSECYDDFGDKSYLNVSFAHHIYYRPEFIDRLIFYR